MSRRLWMVVGLMACVALSAVACSKGPQAPKLKVEEELFDFGALDQGSVVKHTFVLRNEGNVPLHIKSAKGSCGCTAVVVSQNEIAPSGEGQIEVSFNTAGRMGSQEKSVTVETDDPANPKARLRFRAKIQAELAMAEPILAIGPMHRGETQTKRISILAKPGQAPFTFGDIASTLPGVTGKVVAAADGEATPYYAEITFKADKIGTFDGAVTIPTTHPNVKQLSFHLKTIVQGFITAEPKPLTLAVDGEKVSVGVLKVKSDKVDFSIKKVTDEGNNFKADIKTVTKNREYEISVTYNGAVSKDLRVEAKLTIQTSNKEEPELVVPVLVIDRRQLLKTGIQQVNAGNLGLQMQVPKKAVKLIGFKKQ